MCPEGLFTPPPSSNSNPVFEKCGRRQFCRGTSKKGSAPLSRYRRMLLFFYYASPTWTWPWRLRSRPELLTNLESSSEKRHFCYWCNKFYHWVIEWSEWLWHRAGMTEVNRTSQESESEKKQQPLLHYGGPSRLFYFNLALKGDDAATRVNALSLERKKLSRWTTGTIYGVRLFFFSPSYILRTLWQKELDKPVGSQLKEHVIGYELQTVAGKTPGAYSNVSVEWSGI